VGGGCGAVLHGLLDEYLHLHGFLLEMPEVIGLTPKHPRAQYHGGDFFELWPWKVDAIVLARVLHDWPNDQAIQILRQAKTSLNPAGKIYVLEMVMLPGCTAGALLDLNMLVMTGGEERTLQKWCLLASEVDLIVKQVITLSAPVSLLILEHTAP